MMTAPVAARRTNAMTVPVTVLVSPVIPVVIFPVAPILPLLPLSVPGVPGVGFTGSVLPAFWANRMKSEKLDTLKVTVFLAPL